MKDWVNLEHSRAGSLSRWQNFCRGWAVGVSRDRPNRGYSGGIVPIESINPLTWAGPG
ncbi:MAG: hypothetical protein VKK80_17280 [Prochlorothrix sp.]|nr:hypothetical protein [Prochlorothrix sp.]